jgi:acetylornithine deacetylase/succinyl-diaminopimelate desuccinylase-like protein
MLSPELSFNAAQAAVGVYGKYAQMVPLASFAAPAAIVAEGKPMISCGLERPTSSIFGPDEHVPLADVEAHARLIAELVHRMAV